MGSLISVLHEDKLLLSSFSLLEVSLVKMQNLTEVLRAQFKLTGLVLIRPPEKGFEWTGGESCKELCALQVLCWPSHHRAASLLCLK